jgi:hypothetical protein
MKGNEFHMRFTKLLLVLLSAGLLVWGAQSLALAQNYPSDYNQTPDSNSWIHTGSEGWIHLSPLEGAADTATMGVHMHKGAEESTASEPPQDSSDSSAVSSMPSDGSDEESSQGD